MDATVPVPESTTQSVSAADAAIISSGSSLSDGVEDYRAARAAERVGKPKEAVDIPVQKADDGTITPADPKEIRKAARAAKQQEINEGARKAAGRVVEDYEKQIKEARERAERAEAELARRSASPAPTPPPVERPAAPPLVASTADPEPDPTDAAKYPGGEYDPKYLRDASRWDARQLLREQEAKASARATQDRATQTHRETVTAFQQRMDEAAKADPDFSTVIASPILASLRPSAELAPTDTAGPLNYLADAIIASPVAPQLLRHLTTDAKHLNDLLAGGPPAFFRLEGTLLHAQPVSSAPAPVTPPETITRAPAPPTTVGTRTTSPADPIAAAVIAGKGNLSDGVRDFRAAKLQERLAAQGRR